MRAPTPTLYSILSEERAPRFGLTTFPSSLCLNADLITSGSCRKTLISDDVVTLAVEEAEEQIARIESFIRRFFRQEAAFLEFTDTRESVF